MYGLDLFSGYGGITKALEGYVRPIAYCEIEKYAQGVLLSRMESRQLPVAPIWDNVQTLDGREFRGKVDIIYGGFPCQNLSQAGRKEGLEGKQSGLFFEVCRLVKEIEPEFIFLENVPGIRTRGLAKVTESLSALRYDLRWTCVSAKEVGAPHLRKRWFMLACRRESSSTNSKYNGFSSTSIKRSNGEIISNNQEGPNCSMQSERMGTCRDVAYSSSKRRQQIPRSTYENEEKHEGRGKKEMHLFECNGQGCGNGYLAYPNKTGLQEKRTKEQTARFVKQDREWRSIKPELGGVVNGASEGMDNAFWKFEPDIPRVTQKKENRIDRIKMLGNGVVPLQVRTAFERLLGIE